MRFLLVWAALLALVGVEVAAALLWRAGPLVVVVGPFLSALVAWGFMRVGQGPALARMCAVAGVVWLVVMLGLGTLDPVTRVDHAVTEATPG